MAANQKGSSATPERPHSINIAIGIGSLVIAALAIWVPYHMAQKQAAMLPIVVLAEDAGGSPVADAEVSLNVPDLIPEHTDTKGQISFRLPKEIVGLDGRISIRKVGFEFYNQQIPLKPRSDFYPVYLKRIPPPAPIVVPKPTPSESSRQRPLSTGSASTQGHNSPAVTGSGNTISYGSSPAPPKKEQPKP